MFIIDKINFDRIEPDRRKISEELSVNDHKCFEYKAYHELGKLNGAHVVYGTLNPNVDRGKGAYLIKICTLHNIGYVRGKSWGTGFYMKFNDELPRSSNNTIAIVHIEGFLNKDLVEC